MAISSILVYYQTTIILHILRDDHLRSTRAQTQRLHSEIKTPEPRSSHNNDHNHSQTILNNTQVLTDNLAPFLRSPSRADAEGYFGGSLGLALQAVSV